MSMREIINFQVLNKGYNLGRHFLPHDANVTEYTTRTTRLSVARELLGNVEALERTGISDGINAVRDIFPRCWFSEEKCSVWVAGLWAYHKKYVKSIGKYIDEPEHEWSNWPDAFRYMAVAMKKMQPKKEVKREDFQLRKKYFDPIKQKWITNSTRDDDDD